MRNAILYAGTIVAVVTVFYLAQLAAQPGEPTIGNQANGGSQRSSGGRSARRTPRRHDPWHTTSRPLVLRSRTTTPRATLLLSRSARNGACRTSETNDTTDTDVARGPRVEAFVKHIHAKFAPIRPQGFGVAADPTAHPTEGLGDVREAVESSLDSPYADLAFASPEEVERTGRYSSPYQVSERGRPDARKTPSRPFITRKVFVGLVQQNCDQKQRAYRCKTAVMPVTSQVHDMDADVDCVRACCARSIASAIP